jgi:membrane associated rhomboid family serine protease
MATIQQLINQPKTAVQTLIFACVLVFVPAWLLHLMDVTGPLYWLTFTPSGWFKPWSCFTYVFLHVGFFHLLGNALWLYFVGSILEDLVGRKHIFWLFLGGGVLGAWVFQAVYSFSVYGSTGEQMQLLGASGGVSAVVIGTAIFTPKYKLFLFGLVEVELRWIAIVKVLLDFGGVFSGSNVGGYTAHLGGVIWGAIYVMGVLKSDAIANIFTKKPSKNAPMRFQKGDKSVASKTSRNGSPSEAEVNAILDKISQVGYNNLSAKEKEILFKASKNP